MRKLKINEHLLKYFLFQSPVFSASMLRDKFFITSEKFAFFRLMYVVINFSEAFPVHTIINITGKEQTEKV